jgi:hypothetical protein
MGVGLPVKGGEMASRVHVRFVWIWLVVPLLLTLGVPLGARNPAPEQDRGTLGAQALRAKELGRASLALNVQLDRPLDEAIESIQSEWAFLLAARTTKAPIAVAGPDFIYTWYVLRLERNLSSLAGSQTACGKDLPTAIHLEPGEIAVPTLGGTATVEGVVVTMTSRTPQPSFDVGRRYLLIGALCPDRAASLPYGDSSVIPVSSDGTIGPSVSPYPFTFVRDIVGLKNLTALERHLRLR